MHAAAVPRYVQRDIMTKLTRLMVLVAATASFATVAVAQDFPNIRGAQDSLQDAMAQLERAPPRFGGHKAQAMRQMRAAYAELDRAIAFASQRGRY